MNKAHGEGLQHYCVQSGGAMYLLLVKSIFMFAFLR